MADSYNKKEREKKRRKKKKDKADKKLQKKLNDNKTEEFMYVDENGNLTPNPPDHTKKKEIKLEDIVISTPKNAESGETDPVKKGTVKFYNSEKRFGFITEAKTGVDIFVHEDSLLESIDEKDPVEFEIGHGPRGLMAVNVKLYKEK